MNKLELLQEELRNYGKVAIAYSGGVDSNFLFHVALETLGKENVLPVLCRGAMMSKEDIEGALEQLKDSNHVVLSVNPLDVEAFHFNHKDRCYHCKRSIMSKVIAVAKEHDFAYVLDGKNKDDEKVYRPGLKACEELGIISPLANNNLSIFSKEENSPVILQVSAGARKYAKHGYLVKLVEAAIEQLKELSKEK